MGGASGLGSRRRSRPRENGLSRATSRLNTVRVGLFSSGTAGRADRHMIWRSYRLTVSELLIVKSVWNAQAGAIAHAMLTFKTPAIRAESPETILLGDDRTGYPGTFLKANTPSQVSGFVEEFPLPL